MSNNNNNKLSNLKKGLEGVIMKGLTKNLSPPRGKHNKDEDIPSPPHEPEVESVQTSHKGELSHVTLNRPKRVVRSPRKRPVNITELLPTTDQQQELATTIPPTQQEEEEEDTTATMKPKPNMFQIMAIVTVLGGCATVAALYYKWKLSA
jgi:hypothetical protein